MLAAVKNSPTPPAAAAPAVMEAIWNLCHYK